jgi:hypothetical protein
MLLALIGHARSPDAEQSSVAAAVVERMSEPTIASFVAGSVVKEQGATERLAQAFEALVPEVERKERLLDLARAEAEQTPLGQKGGFDELWQSASARGRRLSISSEAQRTRQNGSRSGWRL